MRDPDTGNSKGFAFINYASFDASDAAMEAMNGQHLCNRAISVSYAFKKDAKGERHGSAAERMLAAQNPLTQIDRPHQLFADAPPIPAAPQMAAPFMHPMGKLYTYNYMKHCTHTYVRGEWIIVHVHIHVYGVKDLWCTSTVQLLST